MSEKVDMSKPLATLVNAILSNLTTVLLIVAAFMIGMLWSKVSYLEKGGTTGTTPTTAQAQNPTDSSAPEVTQLSDDQWKEIQTGAIAEEGNKNAKVTMVEFSDFQCPFCEQFYTQTYGQIKKDYIDTGKVRLIFRQLPLVNLHPNAHIAAEATTCANDQSKFWQMHDKLFQTQSAWSGLSDPKSTFQQYAQDLGMNANTFSQCLTSGKYKQKVDDELALSNKIGANGTPTFYVNGKQIVGALPYSQFKTELDSALQ